MHPTRSPSEPALRIAALLEDAIDDYVRAIRTVEDAGQWEAAIEGWALGTVMLRHIEGVIVLARSDEVLALPATTLARAAFEHSIRACWLLHPSDRFQAEPRWLAYLEEREKFERDLAAQPIVGQGERHTAVASTLHEFRVGVEAKLPRYVMRVAKAPSIRKMLEELGTPEMYAIYRMTSQPVHGTAHATKSYIQNLGALKDLGDFVDGKDWVLPLRLSWLALKAACRLICDRFDVREPLRPNWAKHSEAIDRAFAAWADPSTG